MTRPDPLLVELERAARALGLAERTVLVAASGGIDSTVLRMFGRPRFSASWCHSGV